ncbi:hypothetical protein OG562_38225 [Streptomyces sp. NBC_01275]|uniref:hypothetical protein n=1 Tax=Streptomyces sp. NBC_01275 TaxID=2903807 RepID=UPI0022537C13|nr:hypothetical protein [Streptomyces sp. NBC_01275]MCX4766715.1 hypothetical protein [Streptomyces sp. NBC_01275]
MKFFRAAAAASAVACIAFGAFMGATHIVSAPAPGTAAHSVLADGSGTDGDSGWGGRVINDVVTEPAGTIVSDDSGWGSSGS